MLKFSVKHSFEKFSASLELSLEGTCDVGVTGGNVGAHRPGTQQSAPGDVHRQKAQHRGIPARLISELHPVTSIHDSSWGH